MDEQRSWAVTEQVGEGGVLGNSLSNDVADEALEQSLKIDAGDPVELSSEKELRDVSVIVDPGVSVRSRYSL